MLTVYRSNSAEILLSELYNLLTHTPLTSVFEPEIFLIQDSGTGHWLSQQLASQFKVWGNYQFITPDAFLKHLAQKISKSPDSLFNRNNLVWCIESLLCTDCYEPEFKLLMQYLTGDTIALKRYQLANELASIFDRYQRLRPQLLASWRNNQLLYNNATEHWQKLLWHKITLRLGDNSNDIVWGNVIAQLNHTEVGRLLYLPKRIVLFGINQLSPIILDFLQALAKHSQIYVFYFSPIENSQHFLNQQRLTTLQHPLLISLGQQAQEWQQLFNERGLLQSVLDYTVVNHQAQSLLQQLQYTIITNQNTKPNTNGIVDDSISFHACHSRMREVEVLKNQLLKALEQDNTLELHDIMVMAPDIQPYAPFISAVFSDIQHSIADYTLLNSNQILNAFIDFLALSQSRFGWQAVFDLLERPMIYPGFDLSDSDLELIKYWLHDIGVRWGKSAEHRQELDLFACDDNTWQALLDRLLMGYAMGDDSHFVDNILPYKAIEGSSAQALGGLHDFLQLLFNAHEQFKQSTTLAEWSERLYAFADQLFIAANGVDRKSLNDLLLELTSTSPQTHQHEIDLDVILVWLQDKAQQLQQQSTAHGFLRGQLTFCSIRPMRVIPAKIIALLGMNEGDFPRLTTSPTFDLIACYPQMGDGSRQLAERYAFLEIILSARQQLLISYIGQSIIHNHKISPAIVVSELLDVLQNSYQTSDWVIYHPLHAFSARYFNAEDKKLFSYSTVDCLTANALQQAKTEPNAWWQGSLPATETSVIELQSLFRFFQHPQRFFLQQQLSVRFNSLAAEPEEREVFALDNLALYSSLNQTINRRLQGKYKSVKQLQAEGHWLTGIMGDLEVERQGVIADEFVERITALNLGDKLDSLPIDLQVGNYRLMGVLGNLYQHGSLFYRYASLKGKDFLVAVLHHLIINQIQPQTTYLLNDDALILRPEHCQPQYLPALIAIYLSGQQRPDAFFVEAALAYLQQSSKNAEAALGKARLQLATALTSPYELELQRLYGDIGDLTPLLGNEFEYYCQTILLPLWQASHDSTVTV